MRADVIHNPKDIMNINKAEILRNICYTELVYSRINKKLNTKFSKRQIEELILKILKETEEKFFSKIGKNFYIINTKNNIKITINSNTFRIITADKIEKRRRFLKPNMTINLTKLKPHHFPLFYKWWNDDEIRKLTSEKDGPIEPKEVDKILEAHLKNPGKHDFIITADKKPIGHILIQKKPRKKHFEIYIAIGEKKFWGQGIGAISMKKAIKWFFKKFPLENILQLEVLTTNEHAISCYKNVGFKTIKTIHRKTFSDTYLMEFYRAISL